MDLGKQWRPRSLQNIRIFNGCEVQIENSVTRVTVRHHEACRVMPNSYPSDGIFNLHWRTIMDSFPCIYFLRKLYLNFHMRYYINITLKYLHFRSRRIGSVSIYDIDVETFGRKWHQNLTSFPSPGRVQRNAVGYARRWRLIWVYTVCSWEFLSKMKNKWRRTPGTPKIGHGLSQPIRLDESTRHIWVKQHKYTYQWAAKGRQKSKLNGKFFSSLSRTEASI